MRRAALCCIASTATPARSPGYGCRTLAFAADGQTLASGGEDQNIFLWDVTTGKQQQKLTGHDSSVLALAFGPDGRLASGGQDGKIKIWAAATGREEATFKGHQGALLRMAFTADSKSLASASHDGVIRDLGPGNRRGASHFARECRRGGALAFAPDGTLACAGHDATMRLWSPARDMEPIILRGHRAAVLALAFSGGGRTLVSGDAEGVLMVWDPARRRRTAGPAEGASGRLGAWHFIRGASTCSAATCTASFALAGRAAAAASARRAAAAALLPGFPRRPAAALCPCASRVRGPAR